MSGAICTVLGVASTFCGRRKGGLRKTVLPTLPLLFGSTYANKNCEQESEEVGVVRHIITWGIMTLMVLGMLVVQGCQIWEPWQR